MGPGPPAGATPWSYLIPMGVALVVIYLRNRQARRLRIERLWLFPAIYLGLLALTLAEAPPPLSALSIGILVASFLIGGAIGWQRARFTEIHLHPETHDLSSRASPIGLMFIFAILVLRYAARDFLAGDAALLHIPVLAVADGFFVLAVAMLSVQRLELWLRASKMLAEAKAASDPSPPSLVS
jgi:hypothetical protein